MSIKISTAARSAAADAIVDLIDGGSGAGVLRVYSGSQPAGPGSSIGAATLLVEITLDDPAFGAASSGVATLGGTPLSGTGVAANTATWFRVLDSNDVAVLDGSVGTSSADLILNTTTISVGLTVEVSSGTVTMPAS